MDNERRMDEGIKVTLVGFIINVFLTLIKIIFGIIGRSKALLADGFHSLSDFITDIVVIFGLKFSSKPVDESHDYGHGKIETFATFIVGIFLILVSFYIFYSSSKTIFFIFRGNRIRQPGLITLIFAFLSIILKEGLYRYTVFVADKIKSSSIRANAWHHRSDALSSIATTVGIGLAVFNKNLIIFDPISAMIVAFFIVKVGINIAKESFDELIEKSLSSNEEEEILKVIESVDGVINPHSIQTRKVGNYIAIDVHIEVDKKISVEEAHRITENVEEEITKKYGENCYINIHIEPNS
ncbi:MAG: cation diffusion facilitator family transporter [bacterium]|nr:cation diffusion facilitator family transporter [bacterium]